MGTGPNLIRRLGLTILLVLAAATLLRAQDDGGETPTSLQIFERRSQLDTLASAPGFGLFAEAPRRTDGRERALGAEPGIGRTRSVEVVGAYLEALMREPGLTLREGRLSQDTRVYSINLFDDVTVRIAKVDMVRDILEHDVLRGVVVGGAGGDATLVMDDKGQITGRVRVGAKSYGIQPAANGLHTVIEYDESSMPLIDDDGRPPRELGIDAGAQPSPPPPRTDQRERAQAAVTLNLMMVYTPRALQLRPNITSDISLFVSNLNTTLSNSATNVQVNLVATNQVNYTETSSTTMSVLLDDATNGAGDFARMASLRASANAELVQVWGATTDACGLAWINDNLDTAGTNLGYYAANGTGVVQITAGGGCIQTSYDSPTHELGHNMGAQHDRYAQQINGGRNVAGPQGYNYGYIDATGGFADVMAYGSQSGGRNYCRDNNISCPNIQYFSNPNVTYHGRPVGIADAQPTAADNARRITEIAPYLVQFRTLISSPRMNIFITSASGGGTIASSTGLSCTSTCTGNVVSAGTTVTLTATPASGRSFSGWGSNSCLSSTATSSGGTCTIVMNGWQYVNASFATGAATTQTLTVSKAGTGSGTVTSAPSGISCGSTCSASFSANSSVTLTAAASSGSTFAGWSNGCSGTAATCTVTMSAARSVTATFNLSSSSSQTLSLTITGSGSVTSAPSGINCSASCTGSFTTGTQVTLNATAGTGATFTGWSGGGCSGSGVCVVTMSAAASVTAAFTSAQTSTQTIALNVTGSGTVTSSPSGFNCRSLCTASFTSGASVTLTATPAVGWVFAGWNGACPGTDTCTVTATAGRTVTATFIQPSGVTVSLGAVYSTQQTAIQSFLRLYNTSNAAGVVQVSLVSESSGATLGTWTSPSIAAGASRQFSVDDIERGTGQTFSKPANYTMQLSPQMSGYAQHVLYRPSDGTLTNLSTCSSGVTANPTQLINVHTSTLDYGFPSTVVINNTGSSTATASLGVYDSLTGAKLGNGNYSTPVTGGGQARVGVAAIEQALGLSASASGLYHYNIQIEGSFTGFLQHLVTNIRAGVITDMTTECSLNPATATPPSSVRVSSVYSSTQNVTQSFLRLHNVGSSAGTARVTLGSATSGTALATWTSPSIAAGASRQFPLGDIEAGASNGFTKPDNYSITVQPQFNGYVQHVLYRPADGTLTNLSTCDAGVGIESSQLINVHSTLLGGNFPSTIVINNTGTSAANVSLGVYDATTGTKLGSGNYAVPNIPANGQTRVLMSTIEQSLGISPNAGAIYHYVVKSETTFQGYLQHLVNNAQVGVITDMTTVCGMNADDAAPDTTATTASIAVGTPVTGSLQFSTDTDWYRASLTGGTTYRVELRGADSSSGTLADPVLYVRDSTGTVIASNDDGGTGLDSALDFTASGSGAQTYYLVATGYSNGTGTYRLSIAVGQSDDVTPDSNSTNGTATVGVERTGTLTVGDRDWFAISLTGGVSYTVDLMGATSGRGTLSDPYLRLMNASGTLVASNDDKSSGCCDSQLSYTPTTSGTYYLVAGSYNDTGSGTYVVVARAASTVASTPVSFQGAYSFNVTYGSSATLRADRIVNTSSSQTSGTLRLELWYFSQPYTPGLSGYKIAQAVLGTLAPGASFSSVNQTVTPLTTPPSGTYYQAFLLTEYNTANCSATDRYCVIANANFSNTLSRSMPAFEGAMEGPVSSGPAADPAQVKRFKAAKALKELSAAP